MNSIEIRNLNEPSYLIREAINQLKTNIEFAGSDIKSVLITSCAPNEGKSTVAFELSRSFANEGKKVCYVDGDLRKSVFNTRYHVVSREMISGLSGALSKDYTAGNSVNNTNIPNLDVITSGRRVPDPTALFKSERMDLLLDVVRKHYDIVIIDSPPLGSVIDAAILAPKCDGTVLVVESNGTSGRMAQKVVRQLEMANANILGVVINKAPTENKKYYYYYGE